MIADEFNEKYKAFLEEGHYGLDIIDEFVVEFLDKLFADLTLIPTFKYMQIKLKFGMARVYTTLGIELETLIEEKINSIIRDNNEDKE